jgi:hypothetical protein
MLIALLIMIMVIMRAARKAKPAGSPDLLFYQ